MKSMTRDEAERIIQRGARILFEYCKDNNIHYLVTGSSGGLDSAVTLGFASRACAISRLKGYQLTSVGLVLPCFSKPDATRLGKLAIRTFGAWLHEMELSEVYQIIERQKLFSSDIHLKELLEEVVDKQGLSNWDKRKKTAQGNLKARLRMALGTYYVANVLGGMVLATGNFSEVLMGFWTICGDVGDFNLLGNIFKDFELYDIARIIGVPQEIIDAKPDADLGDGNDEKQLGAPYSVIDPVMIKLIQLGFDPNGNNGQLDQLPPVNGYDSILVRQIATRSLNTAFKRRGTIVVTREELGLPTIKDIEIN
jgi:NAD+ synthase